MPLILTSGKESSSSSELYLGRLILDLKVPLARVGRGEPLARGTRSVKEDFDGLGRAWAISDVFTVISDVRWGYDWRIVPDCSSASDRSLDCTWSKTIL